MKRQPDNYTIVVFRGPTHSPLRVSIPRKILRFVAILGILLLLGEALLVARMEEVWEVSAVRAENENAREQMTVFSATVEDLKRRLVAMKEINDQLRVMLGIDLPRQEDLANGRGGEETPILEETYGLPEPQASRRIEGPQAPAPEKGDLISQVKKDLAWLQQEAVLQERSLEEVTALAKARSARWASTPSVWPVKGWVTSGFGPRISPFTGQLAMHTGLDIGAPPNAEVRAPANGRVTLVEFDPKMGKILRLDHGYGLSTQYGHLSKVLAKKGQMVRRGDLIGLVGNTGLFSTGPHLHYQVSVNNQAVNPQRYILN
jgi:murein DD-endopeptidase MepM/ murein hydrolase activator NlpD